MAFPNQYTTAWSIVLLASMERYYFPCGSSTNGIYDLHANPSLLSVVNTTNAKFSPVMNQLIIHLHK